jgi:hypothetical protein
MTYELSKQIAEEVWKEQEGQRTERTQEDKEARELEGKERREEPEKLKCPESTNILNEAK